MKRIFQSEQQRDAELALLKCTPCPHCKHIGAMNRHGYLRGYDEQHFKHKAVRAVRVFCSNRGNAAGCGRTFSLWVATKVKRLFLDTKPLWQFLRLAVTTGNKFKAFASLESCMSHSAVYRIWKRFTQKQSVIRTKLAAIRPPPQMQAEGPATNPLLATLEHLRAVTGSAGQDDPIAALQVLTQSFFL